MMFAIDTNLLVYAHNMSSPLNERAKLFVEQVMNERDGQGKLTVCIPAQVLMEFIHIITWERLGSPLPLKEALQIVQDYLNTEVTILYHRETQMQTFMELCRTLTSRKKVFDVALTATLKDNGIFFLTHSCPFSIVSCPQIIAKPL